MRKKRSKLRFPWNHCQTDFKSNGDKLMVTIPTPTKAIFYVGVIKTVCKERKTFKNC